MVSVTVNGKLVNVPVEKIVEEVEYARNSKLTGLYADALDIVEQIAVIRTGKTYHEIMYETPNPDGLERELKDLMLSLRVGGEIFANQNDILREKSRKSFESKQEESQSEDKV